MARYIDADAFEQRLTDKDFFFPALYKNELDDIPTADVVPKSEVLALENEIERLKYILDSYALQYGTVMDQHLVIEKERAEVAREIFEEIEKHRDKIHGIALLLPEELAELKKKYTEGE